MNDKQYVAVLAFNFPDGGSCVTEALCGTDMEDVFARAKNALLRMWNEWNVSFNPHHVIIQSCYMYMMEIKNGTSISSTRVDPAHIKFSAKGEEVLYEILYGELSEALAQREEVSNKS